jgi:hypothetical protein
MRDDSGELHAELCVGSGCDAERQGDTVQIVLADVRGFSADRAVRAGSELDLADIELNGMKENLRRLADEEQIHHHASIESL